MSENAPKTKLKKIVIQIAGSELELTPDQAKELRDILADLYGENVIKRHEHHHHDYPWRYWHYTYPAPEITWTSTSISGDFQNASSVAISSDTVYLSAA